MTAPPTLEPLRVVDGEPWYGTYRVEIPLRLRTNWISLNRPAKHKGEHIRWNAWRKSWRRDAFEALADAEVPQELGRIRLLVELRFVDRRTRDASNFYPTMKPMIDALQPTRKYDRKKTIKFGNREVVTTETVTEWGWGVIEGDDRRYLDQTEPIIGPPIGRGARKGIVIFHITPITEESA